MTDLAEKLKECNLADASVKFTRETVCPIKADAVEENMTLSVTKSYPPDRQDDIDKFKESAKELIANFGVEVGLKCEVGEGCQYQTITDITTCQDPETKVNLEHDGQVWLLDFWATWCPPCQKPMAHNEEMLQKNADAWKGKVRIIGLSIDQSADAVVKHVKDKKWETVEHFHRAGSKCSEVYSVKGVPHVMLVDQNGKIVFKGHPAGRPDLEKDLNDLAEGKELTKAGGDEEKEADKGDGEAGDAPKKEPLDAATMHAEIDKFKTEVGPQL